MLEWVVISSSRGSSPPKDRNRISYVSCIRILATESLLLLLLSPLLAGGFFTSSTTWEAHMRLYAIFIFLFLTSFCVKGSRFTHLSSIGSLPPFLEGGVRGLETRQPVVMVGTNLSLEDRVGAGKDSRLF